MFKFPRKHFWVLLGYIVLSPVLTQPLIWHINSRIIGCCDATQFLWFLWWYKHCFKNFLYPFSTNYQFFPETINLLYSSHVFGVGIISIFLQSLFSLACTYNILILLSCVATGYTTFLLLRDWQIYYYPSFLGGMSFAFCFARFYRIYGHLNLLQTMWIPLILMFAWRIIFRERRFQDSIWLGIVMALSFYHSYYFSVFSIVMLIILLFFKLILDLKPFISTVFSFKTKSLLIIDYLIIIMIISIFIIILSCGISFKIFNIQIRMNGLSNPTKIISIIFVFRICLTLFINPDISNQLLSKFKYYVNDDKVYKRFELLLFSALVTVIGVAPLLYGIFCDYNLYGETVRATKSDFVFYASDLLSYIYPSTYSHPHRYFLDIFMSPPEHVMNGHIEQSNYLGIFSILFGMFSFLFWRQSKKIKFIWFLMLVSFLFSLGISLPINGEHYGNLSSLKLILLTNYILDMPVIGGTRVISRYGFLVKFGLSIVVAITIHNLLRCYGTTKIKRITLITFFILALLIDCNHGFINETTECQPNKFLKKISHEEPSVVLNLPLSWKSGAYNIGYTKEHSDLFLYHATLHEQRIISGYASRLSVNTVRNLYNTPLSAILMCLQERQNLLNLDFSIIYGIKEIIKSIKMYPIKYIIIEKRISNLEELTTPVLLVLNVLCDIRLVYDNEATTVLMLNLKTKKELASVVKAVEQYVRQNSDDIEAKRKDLIPKK